MCMGFVGKLRSIHIPEPDASWTHFQWQSASSHVIPSCRMQHIPTVAISHGPFIKPVAAYTHSLHPLKGGPLHAPPPINIFEQGLLQGITVAFLGPLIAEKTH